MKRYGKLINILVVVLLAAGALVSVSGCNVPADRPPEAIDKGVVKTYQNGQAEVRIRASADAITIADRLILEIEAEADEGFEVKLPEFHESMGRFNIADKSSPPPALVKGNRVRHLATYHLTPFLSGDYTIPSMRVKFAEIGQPDGDLLEIETEAINISVKSVLPENAEPALKTIMPPETLPETINPWLVAGVLTALAIGAVGLLGVRRLKKRKSGAQTSLARPAHEIAEEELQQLFSTNLLEAGRFKLFYQRLSAILRRYIENRFGLRAPEQTTEEFLNTMRTADELTSAHKQLLKTFLIHCDQVKFAEHHPAPAEVRKMSETCRRFIAETRPAPEGGSGSQVREARDHAV